MSLSAIIGHSLIQVYLRYNFRRAFHLNILDHWRLVLDLKVLLVQSLVYHRATSEVSITVRRLMSLDDELLLILFDLDVFQGL